MGEFKLSGDTIIVKPVMRSRNSLVTDPEHEAFFLMGSSTITYTLPLDRQGNLLNPFSKGEDGTYLKGEREWLESELDMDLGHHKVKDNAWRKFKVVLGKEDRVLHLDNPKHYVEYLILRANRLFVAPLDTAERDCTRTQRYRMASKDIEIKEANKQSNLKRDAYKLFGKLEESKEDMLNFLKVYGKKKVSASSKPGFLIAEIGKIVEEDTEVFLKICKDKAAYSMKLLVAEAVEYGIVIKKGRKYSLPGGDNLCGEAEQPTIENVIKYLKQPGNQDIFSAIKARVELAQKEAK